MDHDRIESEKIIERFVMGTLPAPMKEAFKAHYKDCSRCYREVHRQIKARYLIDNFVLEKLLPEEAVFFEEHLFECDECFQQTVETEKVVLGLKDAVAHGSFPFTRSAPFRHVLWDKVRSVLSSPRFIYAATLLIILALAYPAWRGWQLEDQVRQLSKPMPLSGKRYALLPADDALRGEPQTIELSADERSFLLNFNLPHKVNPDHRYQANIYDANGELLWAIDNLRPRGRFETFTLVCRASAFEEGVYRVEVLERNAGGNILNQFSYVFQIDFKINDRKNTNN